MLKRAGTHMPGWISRLLRFPAPWLFGCSTTGKRSDVLYLTEDDSGSQVQMRCGDTLEIALSGNPTTGFQWQVERYPSEILTLLHEVSSKPDDAGIGTGGTFIFVFAARGEGEARLQMVYRRPFEAKRKPLRTFEATVVVRDH